MASNVRKDIYVLTNAVDPTTAIIQSTTSASVATNIPIVQSDATKFRFHLMEQDQTTGQLRNKQLATADDGGVLESLRVCIRSTADDKNYGRFSGGGGTGHAMSHATDLDTRQTAVAEVTDIYVGETVSVLGGEYVALSLLEAETAVVSQQNHNVLYWFRTTDAVPPNISGYRQYAVDLTEGDSPSEKLATAMNAHSLIETATHEKTGIGERVRVTLANEGKPLTSPSVSDTTKMGIAPVTIGQDYLYAYTSSLDLDGAGLSTGEGADIATDMSTADTLTGKMVIQITNASSEATLAIQDCTIYRDFSDH